MTDNEKALVTAFAVATMFAFTAVWLRLDGIYRAFEVPRVQRDDVIEVFKQ